MKPTQDMWDKQEQMRELTPSFTGVSSLRECQCHLQIQLEISATHALTQMCLSKPTL